MKKLIAALYIACLAGASPALADIDAAIAAREGDMMKLVFHETPQEVSTAEFTLADEAGTATLADYKGRVVLLNFWATWCAPCRAEMPILQQLYETYRDDGLRIVAVNAGEAPDVVRAWVEALGLNYDIARDDSRRIEGAYRLTGWPTTFMISPQGIITHKFLGPVSEEDLRAALAPFL